MGQPGDTGASGSSGDKGFPGASGNPGYPGISGSSGAAGIQGTFLLIKFCNMENNSIRHNIYRYVFLQLSEILSVCIV